MGSRHESEVGVRKLRHVLAVVRDHVARVAAAEHGIGEPAIDVAVEPSRGADVRRALARRVDGHEVQRGADRCPYVRAERLHGEAVRNEQVMRAVQRFGEISVAGREQARLVAEKRHAPGLVVREPERDAIAEPRGRRRRRTRQTRPPCRGRASRPRAHREGPSGRASRRRDALLEQRVHQAFVKIEPLLVQARRARSEKRAARRC